MDARRLFRRLGCGVLLALWFAFLTTPCLILVLATQREIQIANSDLPNDAFRVWVLQGRGAQGLAISTARRVDVGTAGSADQAACLITDVRFVLWQGNAEEAGALPVHECTCYARQNNAWSLSAVGAEACMVAGEPPENE